jgi:putative ABC transport system permease protein
VAAQDTYDQFFETLGTPAHLGHTLQASDYQPGAAHVVVISGAMWIKRFGADPGVIGRRISLDRESYEIVGVMPAGFYPTSGGYPELWTPHWANQKEKDDRVTWGLITVARLKPGVTWEQAQTELDVVSARMTKDHPTSEKMHAVVVPVSAQLIGSSWKLLLLLSGGVTLLLLIACVNVANLLLARVVDREKEFSIRTALGAGRGRLALQLFIEGLIFAIAAGVVGAGVASAGTRALLALLPRAAILPRLDSVKVDLATLAFVCGLTLLTSVLFSLIPLFRTSRNRPYDLLKMEGRSLSVGKSKRRLGQIFVVSEFVFSLVLLILGILLIDNGVG